MNTREGIRRIVIAGRLITMASVTIIILRASNKTSVQPLTLADDRKAA
jgi:hypothetical protein